MTLRILDLGCGRGSFLDLGGWISLRDGFPEAHIIGLDLQSEPEARVDELVLGDVRSLPFAEAYFDVVACINVLEHLADPETALAEIRRVLARSGTLFLAIPNGRALSDRLYRAWCRINGRVDHRQRFTLAGARLLLRQAGFVIEQQVNKVETYGWLPSPRLARLLTTVQDRLQQRHGDFWRYGWFFVARRMDAATAGPSAAVPK